MAECFDSIYGDDENTCVKTLIDSVPGSITERQGHDIPDLPPHKDYHFFVCYMDINSTEVRTIVKNLEKEGLKCCYHERDFHPGHNILQSMNNGIKRSMAMLIILSEEFTNDNHGYFHHEIQQAIHARITDGYNVIPMKIEPCSYPETLKLLTYIDASTTDVNEMHILVMNAFLYNVLQVEQNDIDGQIEHCALKAYKPGRKWFTVNRYKLDITPEKRSTIWEKGFQMSNETLDEIERIVNESVYVRYRHIFNCQTGLTTLFFFMLTLFNLALQNAIVASLSGRIKDVSRSQWANIMFWVSVVSIVLLWLIVISIDVIAKKLKTSGWRGFTHNLQEKSRQGIIKELRTRINCETVRRDQTFVVFKRDILQILRFDFKPCQDVFSRRCEHRESLTKYILPQETHMEYTKRMFDTYLMEYGYMFTEPCPTYSRHRMVNGASCLCYLVEQWISLNK